MITGSSYYFHPPPPSSVMIFQHLTKQIDSEFLNHDRNAPSPSLSISIQSRITAQCGSNLQAHPPEGGCNRKRARKLISRKKWRMTCIIDKSSYSFSLSPRHHSSAAVNCTISVGLFSRLVPAPLSSSSSRGEAFLSAWTNHPLNDGLGVLRCVCGGGGGERLEMGHGDPSTHRYIGKMAKLAPRMGHPYTSRNYDARRWLVLFFLPSSTTYDGQFVFARARCLSLSLSRTQCRRFLIRSWQAELTAAS